MKQNILIVEDHELTRFGLKTTFEGVDFIENIYEADSAENAIQIFNNNKIFSRNQWNNIYIKEKVEQVPLL